MRLVKVDEKYEEQHKKLVNEFEKRGEVVTPNTLNLNGRTYKQYVQHIRDREIGINQEVNIVKATLLYLIVDGEIVGATDIRYELNEYLQKLGHIGYGIKPTKRGNGYGNKILELALETIKSGKIVIKEKNVLVTCNVENKKSEKVIIKNGGKLKDEVEHNGEKRRQYLICIK